MFLTVPGCPAERVEGQGPQAQWEPVGDDDLIMMMMMIGQSWSHENMPVATMIYCGAHAHVWKYFFSFRFWFPFSGKEQAHQYQTMYFSLLKWHICCFARGWFELNGISFAQSRVSLWLVRVCLWIRKLNENTKVGVNYIFALNAIAKMSRDITLKQKWLISEWLITYSNIFALAWGVCQEIISFDQ